MYGGLIYGADGLPLKGADGGLVFSDAIAPSATHIFTDSVGYNPSITQFPMTFPESSTWATLVSDYWDDLRALDTLTASGATLIMQAKNEFISSFERITLNFILGRVRFVLPEGVRGNLTRMQARIISSGSVSNGASGFTTANMTLGMALSESATAFATGGDLLDTTFDASATFATVNAATHDNAQGAIEYRVDLPVDGVNDYASDTFYLWFAMFPDAPFPYKTTRGDAVEYLMSAKTSGMKIGLET